MHKKPRRRVLSCGGAANAKLLFLSSCARHKARYIDGLCAGLRVLEEFCNIPYCKIRLINGQCTHYFKDNVPHFLLAKPFLHESTVREILFSYNLFIIHAVIRSFLGDMNIMRMALLQGCSGDLHKSAGLLQGLDILCTAVAHTGTEAAE